MAASQPFTLVLQNVRVEQAPPRTAMNTEITDSLTGGGWILKALGSILPTTRYVSFITPMTSTIDDSFKQFWLLMLSGYVPHCSTVAAQDSHVECECQKLFEKYQMKQGELENINIPLYILLTYSGIFPPVSLFKVRAWDRYIPPFET